MSLASRDMYTLLSVHIVCKLLVYIVSYSCMLSHLYTMITHVYRGVIFANFVVMIRFKFMYAILRDTLRYLSLVISRQ